MSTKKMLKPVSATLEEEEKMKPWSQKTSSSLTMITTSKMPQKSMMLKTLMKTLKRK